MSLIGPSSLGALNFAGGLAGANRRAENRTESSGEATAKERKIDLTQGTPIDTLEMHSSSDRDGDGHGHYGGVGEQTDDTPASESGDERRVPADTSDGIGSRLDLQA